MIVYVAAFPAAGINISVVDESKSEPVELANCWLHEFPNKMMELFRKYQYKQVVLIGVFEYTNMLATQLEHAMPYEDFEIIVEINEKFEGNKDIDKLIDRNGEVLND